MVLLVLSSFWISGWKTHKHIPLDWTPILETTRSFSLQHYKTYYVTRRQFPLQIAAGKTIHKAQDSTLKGVVINFEGRKTEHIHYVGLSRVHNLNSAFILNLNEKKICVSGDVQSSRKLYNKIKYP